MKIVFHEDFYRSDYISDCASVPQRMESIMQTIKQDGVYEIVKPKPALPADLALAHTQSHIEKIRKNIKWFEMASLAAGGAILASKIALAGEPSFAAIRPPGHHASQNSNWGYCAFCNMGISLLKLKEEGLIESAFVLDFDAHTGDGTKEVLANDESIKILNPMAETNKKYLKLIEDKISSIEYVDIIGVSAGFDTYIKDLGKKLTTFDFYMIGRLLKKFSKRMGHQKRFAILEGGYYLPDLGKNVLAFCQGFE